VVAALLGALGVPGNATGTAAREPVARAKSAPCLHAAAPAAARVRAGTQSGADPNTVSAETARSMDQALQRKVARLAASGRLGKFGTLAKPTSVITISTHVHVITTAQGKGGVTARQIADQIRVMNAGYAGTTSSVAADTQFQFRLDSVDYTANDAWYDWHMTPDFTTDDAEAAQAKRALHIGGWDDLNIYVAGLGDGLLGYATFPQQRDLGLDGLVLLNESLPGGKAAPYNEGDTATHEIGHWLGLFHTFQDGCQQPGDYVDDTPYQADGDNIFFCNESDDTCTQPGLDPVHNFMSYGDDPCLDRFTDGQAKRMAQTWTAFRDGK
jgi:hypothetical protein